MRFLIGVVLQTLGLLVAITGVVAVANGLGPLETIALLVPAVALLIAGHKVRTSREPRHGRMAVTD